VGSGKRSLRRPKLSTRRKKKKKKKKKTGYFETYLFSQIKEIKAMA